MKNMNILSLGVLISLSPLAALAIPSTVNFQGRLTDSSGNSINATESMQFSIWSAASGGTELWNETQSVAVSSGLYDVGLGNETALSSSVFSNGQAYLQIQVGSDAAMTPRIQFQSAPYSLVSPSSATSVTNITTYANGSTLQYPDGVWGSTSVFQNLTPSNPYTVPAGDNLYAIVLSTTGASMQLNINSAPLYSFSVDSSISVIAGPGAVLSASGTGTLSLAGFIMSATVTALVQTVNSGSSYTVPAGKTLYSNSYVFEPSDCGTIVINGTPFGNIMPPVLSGGSIVTNATSSGCNIVLNGYLK